MPEALRFKLPTEPAAVSPALDQKSWQLNGPPATVTPS